MTDTFRAMCAELIEAVLSDDSHIDCMQIARRARALLAQPVAQPPADAEAAELAAELRHFVAEYQKMRGLDPENIYSIHQGDAEKEAHLRISRLSRIAELLGRPTPQPPADGEVAEVAAWLRLFCSEEYESLGNSHDPDVAWLTRAAELLEQRHLAPPGEERIGNWLLPEKPPLPEHWSGDLEYGFETAWETARALLQQRYPTPVPVSELPQGWHMLCDIEPEPGAMCDWVIMAPWGCDHGSGEWRDYDGVSPCEVLDVPVGWSVRYKGFANADGVMVSDPELTAWRMLSLPTMAAEARL